MTTITARQVVELPRAEAQSILLADAREVMHAIHVWKRPISLPHRDFPLLPDHYESLERLVKLIDALEEAAIKEEAPPTRTGGEAQSAETAIAATKSVQEVPENSNIAPNNWPEKKIMIDALYEEAKFTDGHWDKG